MTHQVAVDSTSCMGTGVCVSLAPDHFDVISGRATVLEHGVPMPDDLVDEVVDSCPMAALARTAT